MYGLHNVQTLGKVTLNLSNRLFSVHFSCIPVPITACFNKLNLSVTGVPSVQTFKKRMKNNLLQ